MGYHFISYDVVIVPLMLESSIIPLNQGYRGGELRGISPLVKIMRNFGVAEPPFIEHLLD